MSDLKKQKEIALITTIVALNSNHDIIYYFDIWYRLAESIYDNLLTSNGGQYPYIWSESKQSADYDFKTFICSFVKDREENKLRKTKVNSKKELREIIFNSAPDADLNHLDVSAITDMSWLFSYSNFNGKINQWDVSNVRCMKSMFHQAQSFNQPIGNWDVSNVESMFCMFNGAKSFNQQIGSWDVSNVKDMEFMFGAEMSFNQALSKWKKKL